MSWTHSSCARCWNERHPDRPFELERDGQGALERCCFCGFIHCTGLYVREAPESSDLACRGGFPNRSTHGDGSWAGPEDR
jgi:hypothetical protein